MSVAIGPEPAPALSPPSPEKLGRATKDILFGSVCVAASLLQIAGMISKVFEHPLYVTASLTQRPGESAAADAAA